MHLHLMPPTPYKYQLHNSYKGGETKKKNSERKNEENQRERKKKAPLYNETKWFDLKTRPTNLPQFQPKATTILSLQLQPTPLFFHYSNSSTTTSPSIFGYSSTFKQPPATRAPPQKTKPPTSD